MRRRLNSTRVSRVGLSLLISGVVVWVLTRQGTIERPSQWIPQGIQLLGPSGFALLVLLPVIGIATSSFKWHIATGHTSLRRAAEIHWASEFASLFGLGSIGGDGFKIVIDSDRRAALIRAFTVRTAGILVSFITLALIILLNFWGAIVLLGVFLVPYGIYCSIKRVSRLYYVLIKLALVTTAQTLLSVVVLNRAMRNLVDISLDSVAVLHIVSFIASAIPFTYQGIGAREAAFALVGSQVAGNAAAFASVAGSISVLTILIRLIGIVPFYTSTWRSASRSRN